MLIVMIGISLGELLSDVAGGRLPSGLMGVLMLLKMPDVLSTIIPLSIFISIIWGTGRMYRDQEMSVMRASGFNWLMLLRPLFNLLMPVAVFLLAVDLFMAPKAAGTVQQKLEEAFRTAAEWGLRPGQFHVFKGGDPPQPVPEAGDTDCSGAVTSADIIQMVNHVFKGGPEPCDVCTLIDLGTWTCP